MDLNNVLQMVRNPLAQGGTAGQFLRLVLAEAASFGMPGDVVATIDDVAAMLGFYKPIAPTAAAHVAGPLINWRTHPDQPGFDHILDVETLAFKQRALIAFGGGPPGQMVGTAEIVVAMSNIVEGMSPPEYYEVFQWASLDVLRTLTGDDTKAILADPGKKRWRDIPDAEVTQPGGRLYPTYQEIATSIRREAIAAMHKRLNHPRNLLRPLAAHILESHQKLHREAQLSGLSEVAARIDAQAEIVRGMFPNIGSVDHEVGLQNEIIDQIKALLGLDLEREPDPS